MCTFGVLGLSCEAPARGIVVTVQGHGPLKVCVWASLSSFCVSPGGPKGRQGFTKRPQRAFGWSMTTRPQFNEKTPPKREKREKMGAGEVKKKERNFEPSGGGLSRTGRSRAVAEEGGRMVRAWVA